MAITYDKERVQFNLARIKKGDDNFEIVVDPDLAIEYKKTGEGDLNEILKSPEIFADAKKGLLAATDNLESRFNTTDKAEIAKIILEEGEIQLSAQYREKVRETKRKKIVSMIAINGVDPKTNLPHPQTRIEAAMDEAKVRIDEMKNAEQQVDDIIKQLRTVLPIKFVVKEIEVTVPAQYAAKSYGLIKSSGKIKKEEWLKDGSWLVILDIPGGLETDFYDKINRLTHGEVDAKVVNTR